MFAIILKSHNGTIHKVWLVKSLSEDELKEIEELAGYFLQEITYMPANTKIALPMSNVLDISMEPTEIMLDITAMNGDKESVKS